MTNLQKKKSLFFFRFFSHIGYCRMLSRAPCAIQQVLVDYVQTVKGSPLPGVSLGEPGGAGEPSAASFPRPARFPLWRNTDSLLPSPAAPKRTRPGSPFPLGTSSICAVFNFSDFLVICQCRRFLSWGLKDGQGLRYLEVIFERYGYKNVHCLVRTAKTQKCPLTDEWVKEIWYIQTQWNTTQPGKKNQNNTIRSNMNGPGGYHIK